MKRGVGDPGWVGEPPPGDRDFWRRFGFHKWSLRKRPYLRLEWTDEIVRAPAHREVQADLRVRFWGYIPALGRWLRVVTLEDGETVHNVFPDRNFLGPGS